MHFHMPFNTCVAYHFHVQCSPWQLVPSWRLALLRFAAPLAAVSVTGPILSTIDTSFVGRCAGTLELAALGPACTVTDLIYLICRTLTAVGCGWVVDQQLVTIYCWDLLSAGGGWLVLVGCGCFFFSGGSQSIGSWGSVTVRAYSKIHNNLTITGEADATTDNQRA